MQSHADAGIPAATAPSSPTRRLCSRDDDDDDGNGGGGGGSGHFFFFSAPASPVHYILCSTPSSTTTTAHYAPAEEGDYECGGAGDFEFAARQLGNGDGADAMSSAEELFVAGRIRVGCLSPIRQEATVFGEQEEGGEAGVDDQRTRPRRARSASPPRGPHLAKITEPSDSFASASSSSSSSTSSSTSSAKNTRLRISLRDLLLGGTANKNDSAAAERSSGFWTPSIWPSSRSKKATTLALPCPCPAPPLQPARRSTSSDRSSAPRRRTTSLPYRQGLVLGCLGFGARSYGLANSMHPLSSR